MLALFPIVLCLAPIGISVKSEHNLILLAIIPLLGIAYWLFATLNTRSIFVDFENQKIQVQTNNSNIDYSFNDLVNYGEIIGFGGRHRWEPGITIYYLSLKGYNKIKFAIKDHETEFQKVFGNLKYRIKLLRSERAKKAVNQ